MHARAIQKAHITFFYRTSLYTGVVSGHITRTHGITMCTCKERQVFVHAKTSKSKLLKGPSTSPLSYPRSGPKVQTTTAEFRSNEPPKVT